jgi:hypothetical protein
MPISEIRLYYDRRLVTIILSVMVAPILWFVGADLARSFYQGSAFTLHGLIQSLLVVLPLAGLVFIRRAVDEGEYSNVVLAVSVALGALMLALSLQRPSGSVLLMRTPILYLVALYGAMPNTFYRQIVPPIAFSCAIAVLRVSSFAEITPGDISSDLIVLLLVNLIGIVIVLRKQRVERELEGLLQRKLEARAVAEQTIKDLRTLQGIIKICSYCRKVHSDKGVWQQIESFVRERTGVEFSHGICPECLAEHYPDGEPIEA